MHAIRRDVLSKFIGEFLSRLVFLIFFFYVGRKLGTEEFGTLSLAISVTYMLGVVFLDPGLNLSTIHMLVARQEQAKQIAGSILSAKLVLFLPTLLVTGILSIALGNRLPSFSILFLAALYALFTVVLEFLSSVTNAFHRMDLEAFLKIFNRVLIVVLGVISLKTGSISALLTSMALATLLASVFAWVLVGRRLIWVIPQWHFGAIREAFRLGLPIAGAVVIGTIYLKWDLLVLSYFGISLEQIGWYAGAFKIVEAFSALPGILGAGLFPMMVELRHRDPASLERLLGVTTKVILLFSIPVTAAVSLFSQKIVLLVYGIQYEQGASVLAILIWCIVPISLYFYLVYVNIVAGRASYNLFAGCVTLVVGLVANFVLVPRIGYMGAAWSAVASNAVFAVLAAWNVSRVFRNASLPSVLLRLITAGACMEAVILLAPSPLPLQLALGFLTYCIVLIALGSLGVGDFLLATRLLQFRVQPQEQ